jgi:hypothetical protein
VLLGRADGEHDPIVTAQVGLELHPVEVADPHRDAETLAPDARLSRLRRLDLLEELALVLGRVPVVTSLAVTRAVESDPRTTAKHEARDGRDERRRVAGERGGLSGAHGEGLVGTGRREPGDELQPVRARRDFQLDALASAQGGDLLTVEQGSVPRPA